MGPFLKVAVSAFVLFLGITSGKSHTVGRKADDDIYNAYWSEWGNWKCENFNGICIMARIRNCSVDTECKGQHDEVKQCTQHVCTGTAYWSAWNEWQCEFKQTACLRHRDRQCIVDRDNTTLCEGSMYEVERCDAKNTCTESHIIATVSNDQAVSITVSPSHSDVWLSWSAWTCDNVMEPCFQHRSRPCSSGFNSDCPGKPYLIEHVECTICSERNTATTLSSNSISTGETITNTAETTMPSTSAEHQHTTIASSTSSLTVSQSVDTTLASTSVASWSVWSDWICVNQTVVCVLHRNRTCLSSLDTDCPGKAYEIVQSSCCSEPPHTKITSSTLSPSTSVSVDTNTQTVITTLASTTEVCKDDPGHNCSVYPKELLSQVCKNQDIALKYCRLTCGLCVITTPNPPSSVTTDTVTTKTDAPCFDIPEKNCDSFSNTSLVTVCAIAEFRSSFCPVTCGVCEPQNTTLASFTSSATVPVSVDTTRQTVVTTRASTSVASTTTTISTSSPTMATRQDTTSTATTFSATSISNTAPTSTTTTTVGTTIMASTAPPCIDIPEKNCSSFEQNLLPIVCAIQEFNEHFCPVTCGYCAPTTTSTPTPSTTQSTTTTATTLSTHTKTTVPTTIRTTVASTIMASTAPPCIDIPEKNCSSFEQHLLPIVCAIQEFNEHFCPITCGYCATTTTSTPSTTTATTLSTHTTTTAPTTTTTTVASTIMASTAPPCVDIPEKNCSSFEQHLLPIVCAIQEFNEHFCPVTCGYCAITTTGSSTSMHTPANGLTKQSSLNATPTAQMKTTPGQSTISTGSWHSTTPLNSTPTTTPASYVIHGNDLTTQTPQSTSTTQMATTSSTSIKTTDYSHTSPDTLATTTHACFDVPDKHCGTYKPENLPVLCAIQLFGESYCPVTCGFCVPPSVTTGASNTAIDCSVPQVCANGGTCDGTSNVCSCVPGYTGSTCDKAIDCGVPHVCANGGTCDGTSNVCSCAPGYTGSTCDKAIDCSVANVCAHGGTCDGTSNVCSCATGYTGATCDKGVAESMPSNSNSSLHTSTTTAYQTGQSTASPIRITTKTNPYTIPPTPTQCAVCSGPARVCEQLHHTTQCDPPNNYCVNQIINDSFGSRLVNRTCGNFQTCYREWFQGSSDNDRCQNFDSSQILTLQFECTFCCISDNCNVPLRPDKDTLYKDV